MRSLTVMLLHFLPTPALNEVRVLKSKEDRSHYLNALKDLMSQHFTRNMRASEDHLAYLAKQTGLSNTVTAKPSQPSREQTAQGQNNSNAGQEKKDQDDEQSVWDKMVDVFF